MQLGLNMVAVLQYTFKDKQWTKQQNKTEYNTYNNTNT